ncbi:hypothetical protein FSPOR_10790 [Fusarium sporotrichioides]|uniref:Xylanolytic transcriptional activator regulatory domain-containing protein n=1 Tax=Fusarium sporotrichioides TaxID=5514 RepID=A0A395RJD3_FUSSP|nr:hypothetical protein FSPOR_10790 [Fusarium sporotrichioides]
MSPQSASPTAMENLPHQESQPTPNLLAPSPHDPESRAGTHVSDAIDKLASVTTDVGATISAASVWPNLEASGLEPPAMLTASFLDNSTFTAEGLGFGDWASLGTDIPWNNTTSLLNNESFGLPHPLTFFFGTPNEVNGSFDLHHLLSPIDSEPAVHQLECEAPTPSFTQSIAIPATHDHSDLPSREDDLVVSPPGNVDPESWRAEAYEHVPDITIASYECMTSTFNQLNSNNAYCTSFTTKSLPSLMHMRIYMQVYFEEFHPVFPLLHKATFSPTKDNWVLSLAISSIGCLFSKTLQSKESYSIMQELLRRTIYIQLEKSQALAPDICLAQASVLNQIGMMYGGDLRFAECAHKTMAQLATQCRKIASYGNGFVKPSTADHAVSQDWHAWIKAELEVRLFYCAWLVDSQQVNFFAFPPTLALDFLQFPMPVHESAWDAPCQNAWQISLIDYTSHQNRGPIRQRLLHLYRGREVPPHLGAFNILLLAMGVSDDASKLRHAPLYLDLLQHHAERSPSTLLTRAAISHIHMLSLLLYFPTRDVIAFGRWRVTETQYAMVVDKLKRWMRNSHDARIALMHACSVWSQIRTRPTAAQHETVALLHSAFAIWALVKLSDKPSLEALDTLPSLRLDKMDDEMKAWAAGAEQKRLYLGGVGLLWHEGAIGRLVRETANLLEKSMAWPQAWCTGPYLRKCHAASETADRNRSSLDGDVSESASASVM